MAVSIVPAGKWWEPIVLRGQVVERIEGDDAWAIIDELSAKYTDEPYPRDDARVVFVVEPEYQKVGIG